LLFQKLLLLVFRKLSLVRNFKCVRFSRRFNSVMHFPSYKSDEAAFFPNLFIAAKIYIWPS